MPIAAQERRQAPRYALDVPVRFDRQDARTRDLSSSGLYLTTPRPPDIGQRVSVDLSLPHTSDLGPLDLRIRARVIRVDTRPEEWGVAAVIEAWDIVGERGPTVVSREA